MSNIKAQTLKGFRDFLPEQARKRQYVINKLKGVFESFGFEPLETPALEYEEVLLGKYGEEGDKLMYRFTDNGGRKVALRYDQTVPLARVAAQYQNELPMPFKRYQIQPVWRAENTQKGRFREFLQCDIDTVGTNSPLADAEVIACVVKSLESLGFKNFKVLINDREVFSQLNIKGFLTENELQKALRSLDKIKKIGEDGVREDLIKNGFVQNVAQAILENAKTMKENDWLLKIMDTLKRGGITSVFFDPYLVRGLDYYTGLIFEVVIPEYGEDKSVGGGGRYDNLIGMFIDQDYPGDVSVPAVGFAFGFDRIVEAMEELNLFPADLATTKVLVTIFSKELEQKSIDVANRLRAQGINCELWLDSESKLDKQLKYADQKGISYVVIIGPNEVQENKFTLKDLKNKTQETIPLDELVSKLTV